MFGRIVKGERLSIVRSGLGNMSCKRQCDPRKDMAGHERDNRPLLLSERQELCRKLAQQIAVKRDIRDEPEAAEH